MGAKKDHTYIQDEKKTRDVMEDTVSNGSSAITHTQLYMTASNTADIMRWWLKHNAQPHQEFTTFINTKPSDIVTQLLQIRREAISQGQPVNTNKDDTNKKVFRVQRLGIGHRVHTAQEEDEPR